MIRKKVCKVMPILLVIFLLMLTFHPIQALPDLHIYNNETADQSIRTVVDWMLSRLTSFFPNINQLLDTVFTWFKSIFSTQNDPNDISSEGSTVFTQLNQEQQSNLTIEVGYPSKEFMYFGPYLPDIIFDYWIHPTTPIYINTTVNTSDFIIKYTIGNDTNDNGSIDEWNIIPFNATTNTTITLPTEYLHNLTCWVEDENGEILVNNTTKWFYVDDTEPFISGPTFNKDYYIPNFIEKNGKIYPGISEETNLYFTINDSNMSKPVGLKQCAYDLIYYNGTNQNIIFSKISSIGFTVNPCFMGIPHVLKDGKHLLKYSSSDRLGNTNPYPNQKNEFEFYADIQPPTSSLSYKYSPYIDSENKEWITSHNKFRVLAEDTGGRPDGSGVEYIEWKLEKYNKHNATWTETENGIIYDQDNWSNGSSIDENLIKGKINAFINVTSNGRHQLYVTPVDYLGNIGKTNIEEFYVDNNPPISSHSITGSKETDCENENITIVTSETEITMNATEPSSDYEVGVDFLHYELWKNNQRITVEEIPIWHTKTITLPGNGEYTLTYYATDLLGNIETLTHQAEFKVDDFVPTISYSIGSPNISGSGEPEYWITSETPVSFSVNNAGLYDEQCMGKYVSYQINKNEIASLNSSAAKNFSIPKPFFEEDGRYEIDIIADDPLHDPVAISFVVYVDNTAPQIQQIIQPATNGEWYTNGASIPVHIKASDVDPLLPHYTPCGFKENYSPEIALIDVFPDFSYITLDTSHLHYNPETESFFGNAIIPSNADLTDGMAVFVVTIKDQLGHEANNLVDILDEAYQNGMTQQEYQSLLQDHDDVIWINIDNTPPEINIIAPNENESINDNSLFVETSVYDALSGVQIGSAVHVDIFNTRLEPSLYVNSDLTASGILTIPSSVQRNTPVPLRITVFDKAGAKGMETTLITLKGTSEIIDETPPTVSLTSPQNTVLSEEDELFVVNATDEISAMNELTVTLHITREGEPTQTRTMNYNPGNGFTYSFDATVYTDNTTITFTAEATDAAGNTGSSQETVYTINSSVRFDTLFSTGWNKINGSLLQTTIPKENFSTFFSSIWTYFDAIIEETTWKNFVKDDAGGHTLLTLQPDHAYWIYVTQNCRFYLEVDQ